MSKIIVTITLKDGECEIKDKLEMSECLEAKEMFGILLNKMLRMQAEGDRDPHSKQCEMDFDKSDEQAESVELSEADQAEMAKLKEDPGVVLIIAKGIFVETIKARDCFVQSLNEELRGMQETVELTYDTDVERYLYDENFLKSVIITRKGDEIQKRLDGLSLEQLRALMTNNVEIKIEEKITEDVQVAIDDFEPENQEIKPAKKRKKNN